MARLVTTPNISDPDGFYAALISAHDGLTDAQSAALNARLILLLANQIGDHATLSQALEAAKNPGVDAGLAIQTGKGAVV